MQHREASPTAWGLKCNDVEKNQAYVSEEGTALLETRFGGCLLLQHNPTLYG